MRTGEMGRSAFSDPASVGRVRLRAEVVEGPDGRSAVVLAGDDVADGAGALERREVRVGSDGGPGGPRADEIDVVPSLLVVASAAGHGDVVELGPSAMAELACRDHPFLLTAPAGLLGGLGPLVSSVPAVQVDLGAPDAGEPTGWRDRVRDLLTERASVGRVGGDDQRARWALSETRALTGIGPGLRAEPGVLVLELADGALLYQPRTRALVRVNESGAELWRRLPLAPPDDDAFTDFFGPLADVGIVRRRSTASRGRVDALRRAAQVPVATPASIDDARESAPPTLPADHRWAAFVMDEGEVPYDYIWHGYQPLAPVGGRFQSVTLLFEALGLSSATGPWAALVERLRAGFGPSRTVWGVKEQQGDLSVELYFYRDPADPDLTVSRVAEALAGLVPWAVDGTPPGHSHMFSFELAPAARDLGGVGFEPVTSLDLYFDFAPLGGTAYTLSHGELELKNLYRFFPQPAEAGATRRRVRESAHVPPDMAPETVLWSSLDTAHTICVANKRAVDGAYFAGIGVDQLLAFLRGRPFPPSLASFVADHREHLCHLRYDVGFDFCVEQGALDIPKSAFYGVF